MPNLMQRGESFLASKLKLAAGRAVTYRQGTITASLTGWMSQLQVEVLQDGVPTVAKVFAWNFTTADLTAEGITPKGGDRIIDSVTGGTFEAMAPDDNKPVKDEIDTSSTITQVWTKRIRNA